MAAVLIGQLLSCDITFQVNKLFKFLCIGREPNSRRKLSAQSCHEMGSLRINLFCGLNDNCLRY